MRTADAHYQVHEAFLSIQGEGANAGQTAAFLRLQGCPVGCSWCLVPSTKIYLANGSRKRIDEVRVGDVLAGYDEANGRLAETVVMETHSHIAPELWSIHGYDENRNTICTADHMWMTTKGWKRTDNLAPGDEILTSAELGFQSWHMRRDNPMRDPATAVAVGRKLRDFWTPDRRDRHRLLQRQIESHRTNMLGDRNPMKRIEVRRRQISTAKRNGNYGTSKIEMRVARIIEDLGLPFIHCQMDVEIDGRYPDFVSASGKKVIEVYHPTFQDREINGYAAQKKEHYANAGYECLPLSVAYGVTDAEIGRAITAFALNGWKVKSAGPQSIKASMYNGIEKVVYDLTCMPYPTFFANGLLSHNCDAKRTWYAGGTSMSLDSIREMMRGFGRYQWVVITGGEPLIYDLDPLIGMLRETFQDRDYLHKKIQIETSGALPFKGTERPDWLTVSPKYPRNFYVDPVVALAADEIKWVVDEHFDLDVHDMFVDQCYKAWKGMASENQPGDEHSPRKPLKHKLTYLMPEGCPPRKEMVEKTLAMLRRRPYMRFGPRLQYDYPSIAALEGDTNEQISVEAAREEAHEHTLRGSHLYQAKREETQRLHMEQVQKRLAKSFTYEE